MDYLEEVDPDVEWAELVRHNVLSDLELYKRKEASQATLDRFFLKASLADASTRDKSPTREEPLTSDKPPASHEPQPSTSTGRFTCTNIPSPSPSLSDIDTPDFV